MTDEPDRPPTWVGRASAPPASPARRASEWSTDEHPVVPQHGPRVVYVERPRRSPLLIVGLLAGAVAVSATAAAFAIPSFRRAIAPDTAAPVASTTASSTPSRSVTPTPTPTPSPPAPGLGDRVRDTAVEFVVASVSCGHETLGEGVFTVHADGQYCVVHVLMTNAGDAPAALADDNQWVITDDGDRVRADHDATMRANGSLVTTVVLLPGQQADASLAFDISEDATIATIELHDSDNSEGAVITP